MRMQGIKLRGSVKVETLLKHLQNPSPKGLPVLPLKQSHATFVYSTVAGSDPFKVECRIQNKA